MAIRVVCETTELAVECLQLGQALGLPVAPVVPEQGWLIASSAEDSGAAPLGIALRSTPELADLVRLSEAHRAGTRALVLANLGVDPQRGLLAGAGADLGLCMVAEVEPLLVALMLAHTGAERPWTASTRGLPAVDRERLRLATFGSERNQGELLRADALQLGFRRRSDGETHLLGRPQHVAAALLALRAADGVAERVKTVIEDVDRQAVLDVLFGPARALSDPASKTALAPYGLPMPDEELCASPSRAAAEASRLTFPVRVALASPDLRAWDHPDLSLDMVDSAAAVRSAFRQLTALAKTRARAGGREPRILGVTVAGASPARALLRIRCTALPHARVATELSFADEHGRAADDRVLTVLPVPEDKFERVLKRLAGHELLLGGTAAQRRDSLSAIADVLLRLAAFVTDFRDHVSEVELRPAALLVAGGIEIREACVTVSEAFERSLSSAG